MLTEVRVEKPRSLAHQAERLAERQRPAVRWVDSPWFAAGVVAALGVGAVVLAAVARGGGW